jgi:hypothetical protein
MAVTSPLSVATNIIATDNDIRVAHSLLYKIMYNFLMQWNFYINVFTNRHSTKKCTFSLMSISLLLNSYMFRFNWHHPGANTYITETYSNKIRMGTGSFPEVKWPVRRVDHPPHLAPTLKKEWSYTSTLLWAIVAYSRGKIYFILLFAAIKYSYNACAYQLFRL